MYVCGKLISILSFNMGGIRGMVSYRLLYYTGCLVKMACLFRCNIRERIGILKRKFIGVYSVM